MNFLDDAVDIYRTISPLALEKAHDLGVHLLSRHYHFGSHHSVPMELDPGFFGSTDKNTSLVLVVLLARHSPRLLEIARNIAIQRPGEFAEILEALESGTPDHHLEIKKIVVAAISMFLEPAETGIAFWSVMGLSSLAGTTLFYGSKPLSSAKLSPVAWSMGVVLPKPAFRPAKYTLKSG